MKIKCGRGRCSKVIACGSYFDIQLGILICPGCRDRAIYQNNPRATNCSVREVNVIPTEIDIFECCEGHSS